MIADPAQQRRLIVDFMPLARSLASRHRRNAEWGDVCQTAYMGLVKAAKRFEPSRGRAFAAFAAPTIVGEIRRLHRDHATTIRIPRRVQSAWGRIREATAEIEREEGSVPTPAQIAKRLHMPLREVNEGLQSTGASHPQQIDDTDPMLQRSVGAVDAGYGQAELRIAVQRLMERLSKRDQLVIRMRYAEERSQREIAAVIGVTQMQVSRILMRLSRQLRESCAHLGLAPSVA